MRVADEAGDARRVPDGAPRLVGEVHADEDVAGDPDALDDLALRVLDLHDLLHGDLHLVDEVLHVEALAAVLEVRLHAVLVARVGVDDVPVAQLAAQLRLERGDRVLVDVGLVLGRRPRPRLGLVGSTSSAWTGSSSSAVSVASSATASSTAPSAADASTASTDAMASSSSASAPVVGSCDSCDTCEPAFSSVCARRTGAVGARPGRGDCRVRWRTRRSSASEDPERELADAQVDHGDEGHDHRDEHEHDARVGDQLRPRGPDDLLQLRDDLADEERDAGEQPATRRRALPAALACDGRAAEPSASDAAAGAVSLTSGPYVSSWSSAEPVRNPDGRTGRRVAPDRPAVLLATRAHRANPADQTRAQGRQDSNLQPAVLETAALPIAPLPYGGLVLHDDRRARAPTDTTRRGSVRAPGDLRGTAHHGGRQPPGVHCTRRVPVGRTVPTRARTPAGERRRSPDPVRPAHRRP